MDHISAIEKLYIKKKKIKKTREKKEEVAVWKTVFQKFISPDFNHLGMDLCSSAIYCYMLSELGSFSPENLLKYTKPWWCEVYHVSTGLMETSTTEVASLH